MERGSKRRRKKSYNKDRGTREARKTVARERNHGETREVMKMDMKGAVMKGKV